MKKSFLRLLTLATVVALCLTVTFSLSLWSVSGEGEPEVSETPEPSAYQTVIFDDDVSQIAHLGDGMGHPKGATIPVGALVDAMVAYSSANPVARMYRVEVTLAASENTYVYPVLLGKLDSTEVWSDNHEPHGFATGPEGATIYCSMQGAKFGFDAPRNLYLYPESETDVSVTHIKVVADNSPAPTTTTTTKPSGTPTGEDVLYDSDVSLDVFLSHGSTLNDLDLATEALRDDVKTNGVATYYKVTYTLTADRFCNIYPILLGTLDSTEVWASSGSPKNSMIMYADTPTEIYGYYLGSEFKAVSDQPNNLYLYGEEAEINAHVSHVKIEVGRGSVPVPTNPTVTYAPKPTTTTGAAICHGDANGDSSVDMKDVLMIRKYIANMGSAIDMTASDVNEDSSVDMKDVLIIRKFIAKLIDSLD